MPPASSDPGIDSPDRMTSHGLAIALVGLRTTIRPLVDVGALPIAIAVCDLVLMFAFAWRVSRRMFRLEREFSVLLAAGCAACGEAQIVRDRFPALGERDLQSLYRFLEGL